MLFDMAFAAVKLFMKIFFPCKITGRGNAGDGPLLVCCNHTGYKDPVLLYLALGKSPRMRFMAKEQLFRFPVFRRVLKWVGAFPVKRGTGDITAIKTSLKALKDGYRLAVFPEGTRIRDGREDAQAKAGAGLLAARGGVPVLPVFISGRKKLFEKTELIIGSPFRPAAAEGHGKDAYKAAADEIMDKIRSLGREKGLGY